MPCRTREKNEKSIACLSRQRMEATILSQIETMDHNSQADEVFGPHNRTVLSGVQTGIDSHQSLVLGRSQETVISAEKRGQGKAGAGQSATGNQC